MIFQAAAQLVPIAAAPAITRLYTSEQYGALGLFGAIGAIGVALSTGRYQRATLLARDKREAVAITHLALLCAAAFSGLFLAAEVFTYPLWRGTALSRQLGAWIFAIPLSILLVAAFDCFFHYSLREGRLRAINSASIERSSVNVGATVALGLAGWGTSGTIAGTVLAQGASMHALSRQFLRDSHSVPRSFERVRRAARRYSKFPRYDMWANLALLLTYNFIPLGLSAYYSVSIVGLYSLAYRLLALPADLIGTSAGELYFRHLSLARGNVQEARRLFRRCFRVTALASVPAILIAPFAPTLFGLIFGSAWRPAGYLVIAIVPHVVARLVSTPLLSTFATFGRQRELLAGQAGLLVTTLATFFVAGNSGLSAGTLLGVHSVAMAIIYAGLLARARHILTEDAG